MGKGKPELRLLAGETLLWTGAPQKRPPYPNLLIGILSLFVFLHFTVWLLGGAVVVGLALLQGAVIPDKTWVNIAMTAFLLGFLWLGCFVNVLRLGGRERWQYVLTDQRIMMVARLLGVGIEYTAAINDVQAMHKTGHRGALTSLAFVLPEVRVRSYSFIPLAWALAAPERRRQIVFHYIPQADAQDVYAAVDELREGIREGEYDVEQA